MDWCIDVWGHIRVHIMSCQAFQPYKLQVRLILINVHCITCERSLIWSKIDYYIFILSPQAIAFKILKCSFKLLCYLDIVLSSWYLSKMTYYIIIIGNFRLNTGEGHCLDKAKTQYPPGAVEEQRNMALFFVVVLCLLPVGFATKLPVVGFQLVCCWGALRVFYDSHPKLSVKQQSSPHEDRQSNKSVVALWKYQINRHQCHDL